MRLKAPASDPALILRLLSSCISAPYTPFKMGADDDAENAFEKPAIVDVVAPGDTDDVISSQNANTRRIHYVDDEENGGPSKIINLGSPLTRRTSTWSVHSLSSVRSGRRGVDPTIALPIQYRTLSYDVEQVKTIEKAKDAREKAAVGKSQALLTVYSRSL
jgi:hypothetical protein